MQTYLMLIEYWVSTSVRQSVEMACTPGCRAMNGKRTDCDAFGLSGLQTRIRISAKRSFLSDVPYAYPVLER